MVSSQSTRRASRRGLLGRLVVALAGVVLTAYLFLTPHNLLVKSDLAAYAVCHRITSHSFEIAGQQLPLCARCTGTFLGALVGLVGQGFVLRRHRAAELPPLGIIVLVVLFIGLMGADGLNSYMTLIPGAPHLYEPQNWLRLVTGSLNGLAISVLIFPVFNLTLWREPRPQRAVANLRDLGVLLLMEAALVGLVLSQWGPLLYPLAVLSAVAVLALLASVHTMIVAMLLRLDNTVERWQEALVPLLGGLTIAVLQVAAIDLLRYAWTGTLIGFPGLGR